MATSAALAAGFLSLELYKILAGGHSLEDYRDSHANLVTPAYLEDEPLSPKVTEHHERLWTVWNHWEFNEEITLGGLIQWLKERDFNVYGISCGQTLLLSPIDEPSVERLRTRVVDLARDIARVRVVPGNHLEIVVCCQDDNREYIDMPCISIPFPRTLDVEQMECDNPLLTQMHDMSL